MGLFGDDENSGYEARKKEYLNKVKGTLREETKEEDIKDVSPKIIYRINNLDLLCHLSKREDCFKSTIFYGEYENDTLVLYVILTDSIDVKYYMLEVDLSG